EGFVTRVTDEPLFLLRMDTDIALARLASGRTVPIGAECGCGVHDGPPGVVWKHAKRSIFGPPFSLQVSCTTVKCRATTIPLRFEYVDFRRKLLLIRQGFVKGRVTMLKTAGSR